MSQGLVSVRNYVFVTAAYWAFTVTDGALRMLVLLHFHALGYTPIQLALIFLLYEFLGALTNLLGGFVGAKIGLKATLVTGLGLQVAALTMLSALSTEWAMPLQIAYVVGAQGLSGVAKDLTKMSAKSSIKLVVAGSEHGALFKWVALLTGSKNALKGAGFFVGGLLLTLLGFHPALWSMAGTLAVAVLGCALLLPRAMGKTKAKLKISQLLSKSRAINLLSFARVFLFGARDVWFVVALPVFLDEQLGWSFVQVGSFMAAWVIGYGLVQAITPRLRRRSMRRRDARTAVLWAFMLAATPLALVAALEFGVDVTLSVIGGLALFGVVFALNSSMHSYLILAYTDREQVATNVGYYYMANAVGRLLGTVLSGLVYQFGGLVPCLLVAALMLAISAIVALRLPEPQPAPAG
jgi:MFS family permease